MGLVPKTFGLGMPSLYTAEKVSLYTVGSHFQSISGDVMLVILWAKKGIFLIPGAKNLLLV